MNRAVFVLGNGHTGKPVAEKQCVSKADAVVGVPLGLSSILLVEASAELRDSRRLLLGILQHPVLSVACYVDVCKLPADSNCCLVAIDTRPHEHQAARVAAHVRKTWPLAKILLLGPPSEDFDDPLYDDSVDARCNPAAVVQAARRLLGDDARQVYNWADTRRAGSS